MALLLHLLRSHFYIGIGLPRYREMKDSFTSFMIYAGIALLVPGLFWGCAVGTFAAPQSGPMDVLTSIAYGFAPPLIAAFIFHFYTRSSLLLQAVFGANTVVAVVVGVAMLLGLIQQPSYELAMAVFMAIGVLCLYQFNIQPEDVKESGYGCKEGEF